MAQSWGLSHSSRPFVPSSCPSWCVLSLFRHWLVLSLFQSELLLQVLTLQNNISSREDSEFVDTEAVSTSRSESSELSSSEEDSSGDGTGSDVEEVVGLVE